MQGHPRRRRFARGGCRRRERGQPLLEAAAQGVAARALEIEHQRATARPAVRREAFSEAGNKEPLQARGHEALGIGGQTKKQRQEQQAQEQGQELSRPQAESSRQLHGIRVSASAPELDKARPSERPPCGWPAPA